MAKSVILEDSNEVNSLYRQDISAIGRKFAGSSLGPFLWIRMVVASFQWCGIRLARRHRL